MANRAMSAADAAWFHNDGPENPAIVTGVVLTRQPLDFATVRAVCQERLLGFPRFRQRVVERGIPLGKPQWQDMPSFDIDLHLHHIALPAPHDEAALRELVSDIAGLPLDHAQPLWQVHLVDDVAGGSALIMRVHHCIADGAALMTVAARLFDTQPGPWRPSESSNVPEPAEASRLMGLADAMVHIAAHPRQVMGTAAALVSGAGMLIGELLKKDDPQSPLKGGFSMGKRVAWSDPVTIKDVKSIGVKHDAKVNDVLVAAMTGALRKYLSRRGLDVNHTTIRAMVPVNLRAPEQSGQLGNAFGLVLLELATSTARRDHRLTLTKTRMDALKRSAEPIASRALLEFLGRVPKALEDFSNDLFSSKASLVMTNVAGPREVLYLAGVPIDRMLAWAPHPGRQLGMAISILSYCGRASLTVVSDAHLLPDPELIAEYFNEEFQIMLSTVSQASKKAPVKAQRKRSVVH